MDSQAHIRAAFRFLTLASAFTIEQDPLAKSEMLWCAASHSMKAVAKMPRRPWPNRSHNDLFRTAERIANRWNQPSVADDFMAASRLHRNMYEGFMGRRAFANAERRVRRLVNHVAAQIGLP